MAAHKWIVFFTFLVLFTFMEEAKLLPTLPICNGGKSFTFTLQTETDQGPGGLPYKRDEGDCRIF